MIGTSSIHQKFCWIAENQNLCVTRKCAFLKKTVHLTVIVVVFLHRLNILNTSIFFIILILIILHYISDGIYENLLPKIERNVFLSSAFQKLSPFTVHDIRKKYFYYFYHYKKNVLDSKKKIRISIALYVLGDPEYELMIFRKCLSMTLSVSLSLGM